MNNTAIWIVVGLAALIVIVGIQTADATPIPVKPQEPYNPYGLTPSQLSRFEQDRIEQAEKYASKNPWKGAATRLRRGQLIPAGNAIISPNGLFALVYQKDNNLVIYIPSKDGSNNGLYVYHDFQTYGYDGNKLIFQLDGNVVIYDSKNKPIWATHSEGSDAQTLEMQDDGNLVLYNSKHDAIWASNTAVAPYDWHLPPNTFRDEAFAAMAAGAAVGAAVVGL